MFKTTDEYKCAVKILYRLLIKPKLLDQLEAPVAGMWRLNGGALENIDVLWAATKLLNTGTFVQNSPPALYIGLHNQQVRRNFCNLLIILYI